MNFGIPKTPADEKLAFVEHVLGVLIESRFGPGRHYTSLDERDSANFTCLSADELGARMKYIGEYRLPFYLRRSLGRRENHLRQRVVMPREEAAIISDINVDSKTLGRGNPTLQPSAHTGGAPPARGSPTFPGT